MDHDVQVILSTDDKNFSVPKTPISVPSKSKVADLNNLVKELLGDAAKENININFDFIIDGEFLLSSLQEYLLEKQSTVEVLEIFFIVRQRPPVFEDEIEQEDFISCVRRFDKYVLTSSYDGTIQIWTIHADDPILCIQTEDRVKCVDWVELTSKSAVFISGSFDQTVRIWHWDLETNAVVCRFSLRGHRGSVMCCQYSGSHLLASGSQDSTVKVWSASLETSPVDEEQGVDPVAHVKKSASDVVPTRTPLMTFGGHKQMISSVGWLPDETDARLISGSWDCSLRAWDIETKQEERCIPSGCAVHSVDAAKQGILTGASDNRVRIYDLRAKEALALVGFRGHTASLSAVSWAPHRPHHFITGSVDGTVRLWDTRNSQAALYELGASKQMITSVDWAAPYQMKHYILTSSADAAVKIFHYPTT